MKLSAADKAYVSDADACVVVCGGGFPRGYRFKYSVIVDINRENNTLPQGITVAKEIHLPVRKASNVREDVTCE